MNSIILNQLSIRGNTLPTEIIQKQARRNCEMIMEQLLHQNDGVNKDTIIFFFSKQLIKRDNISSARKSRYRTDEIVRIVVEAVSKGSANLHHRVSSFIQNNIRNSIFCYSKIKKVLKTKHFKTQYKHPRPIRSLCF